MFCFLAFHFLGFVLCVTDYQLTHLSVCDSSNPSQQWDFGDHVIGSQGNQCLKCFLTVCTKNDLLSMADCDESDDSQSFFFEKVFAGSPIYAIGHRTPNVFTYVTPDEISAGSLARMMPIVEPHLPPLWHYDSASKALRFHETALCLDRANQFYDKWMCSGSGLPSGYVCGCLRDGPAALLPFCNTSLSLYDRVWNLIHQLSLQEKQGLLGSDLVHTGVDDCTMVDGGVLRLGIPPYTNLVETNSAVSSLCIGKVALLLHAYTRARARTRTHTHIHLHFQSHLKFYFYELFEIGHLPFRIPCSCNNGREF